MKDAIVDSQLWIRLDLDISLKANVLFNADARNRSHFLSLLLLYNKIYIPTKDFGIVPILINWLGLKNFITLLETDSLGFVFLPALIGYGGGITGLSLMEIVDSKEKPFEWHQATMFSTSDKSIELQILHNCPFISYSQRSKICLSILRKTIKLELSEEFFKKTIIDETFRDIKSNDFLSKMFQTERYSDNIQILNSLSYIKNDQYRILGQSTLKDPIDYLLRVAEINLELILGHVASESDIGTSLGSEKLIINKIKRLKADNEQISRFLNLLELNNIPDIGCALVSGIIDINDFLKLRNSRIAKSFRKWLQKCDIKDARDLEKLYVETLRNKSIVQSLPIKLLRFFISTGIGFIEPVSGTITGVMDNFIIDKMANGYNPSIFINDLNKLTIEKEDK